MIARASRSAWPQDIALPYRTDRTMISASVFPATSFNVRLPAYGIYGALSFRDLRTGAGRSGSGFQPAMALACSLP